MMMNGSYSRRRSALLAAALLWCAPPLAIAQDEDGERRARALIDGFFDGLSQQIQTQLQFTTDNVSVEREYQLTETGGVYRADFSKAAVRVEQVSVDLATMAVDVEPGADGRSALSIRLPNTIPIAVENEPVASVVLGSQQLTGTWSESLDNITDITTQFGDIRVNIAEDDAPDIRLDKIGLIYDLSINDDQTWKQTSDASMNGLFISGDGSELSMAGGEMRVVTGGNNFAAVKTQSEQLQQLMTDLQRLDGEDDEELAKELLPQLQAQVPALFDNDISYAVEFSARDLTVVQNGVTMGNVALFGGTSDAGVADAEASFSYRLQLSGLDVPSMPVPPPLAPQQFSFGMTVSGITKQLVEQIFELAVQASTMSDEEAEFAMQLQLPGLLMSSPLKVVVDETRAVADGASVDLDAELRTSQDSAVGVLGGMLLVVRGLPTVIELTGLDQVPNAAQALAMFTAFSERSETNGEVVDRFDLDIGADGRIMLNGKDVSALLGMGPPQ